MPPTFFFFFQFYDLRGREVLNRKRVSILAEMYSNPMCGANGLSTHWLRNCFGPHWSRNPCDQNMLFSKLGTHWLRNRFGTGFMCMKTVSVLYFSTHRWNIGGSRANNVTIAATAARASFACESRKHNFHENLNISLDVCTFAIQLVL